MNEHHFHVDVARIGTDYYPAMLAASRLPTKPWLLEADEIGFTRQEPGKPELMYSIGQGLPVSESLYLSMIGARKVSQEVLREVRTQVLAILELLGEDHPSLTPILVSGLARGVDGIVHRTALEAGVGTIGVPSVPLNREQREGDLSARQEILGAIEHSVKGTQLLSRFKPTQDKTSKIVDRPLDRNGDVASLGEAVVLLQANQARSGSMHTSLLALLAGRSLFVDENGVDQRSTEILQEWAARPQFSDLVNFFASPAELLALLGEKLWRFR